MKTFVKMVYVSFLSIIFLLASEKVPISGFPTMEVSYFGDAEVFNVSCDKLSHDDPFYRATSNYTQCIKVMECILNEEAGDTYSILFTIGEGGVSWYDFYLEGEYDKAAFVIYSDDLDILRDGIIIATGSVGEMYRRSRAYKVKSSKIEEIEQAFYAINIQSIANNDFKIFKSKRLRKTVDCVKKDEIVTVLASEFKDEYNYYLIKSARGLCGWIEIAKGIEVDRSPLKNIYYHGD